MGRKGKEQRYLLMGFGNLVSVCPSGYPRARWGGHSDLLGPMAKWCCFLEGTVKSLIFLRLSSSKTLYLTTVHKPIIQNTPL